MKDKIIQMLGMGITPTQVALACGVTDSYISQLLSDEAISQQVAELRTQRAARYVEHDTHLEDDEEFARKKVRKNMEEAFLKPMEMLKHFQVLNAARRSADSRANTQVPTSTLVTLNVPAQAVVQFKLTRDQQVIEVDGRSMTTMPASTVNRLLREKRAVQDLEDAAVKTPAIAITPDVQAILDTI